MAVATRDDVRLELEAHVAASANGFGAEFYLWKALQVRGKVLAGEEGFAWGTLALVLCDILEVERGAGVRFAASAECLIAALDVFDDIEDADAPDALWRECGVATATNVATMLLFLSQHIAGRLAERGAAATRVVAVMDSLSSAGIRACCGQQQDLDQNEMTLSGEDGYLSMIGRKSAGLVEALCQSAAILGGASICAVEQYARFGFNIGMTMQIMNDVVGVTGEHGERDDLRLGKRTLPLLFALECAPAEVRDDLADLLRRDRRTGPSRDETEGIRRILASSGALQYATTVADAYWERAMTCLEHVGRERTVALLDFLAGIRGD